MKKLLALLALAVPMAFGQLQTLTDTLTTPQGGTFSGTITVTLNNPASAQPLYYSTTTLTGASQTFTITSGVVSMSLYANSTIVPAGTSYTARYVPSTGSAYSETWVVPVGATTIREIRSTTVPTPSVLFTLGQIRQGGATLNQLMSWNGSTWAPTTNVAGNAATATALAANGANCTAGSFPLGVDASGAAETCTALPTTITGTASQITASAATGAVTLSLPSAVSGLTSVAATTFTGALTGNASTATTLQTARTIAGVSFNGSANIAIPSTGLSDTADIVRGGASVAATQVLYGTGAGVAGSDAAFVWDNVNGRVGLGTTSPTYPLDVVGSIAATVYGASSPAIAAQRARGTSAAPTAVLAGDYLVTLGARAYNGSAFAATSKAYISAKATEAWSTTANGTSIVFATTPNTTTTPSELVTINSTGNLLVGTTTDGNFKLDIASSGSSGTLRAYDQTATTGVTQLIVRAGAGQSSTNLQTWQNNAGTILASVSSAGLFLAPLTTPASATATGVAGTIVWDANYIYVATSTNTWKRVAIATW